MLKNLISGDFVQDRRMMLEVIMKTIIELIREDLLKLNEKVQQIVDLLRTHNDHATIVTTPWDILGGKQLTLEMA